MHRYGRHGPRAWLKWRRRHTPRPSQLPVPVVRPQTTVFRVRIPISTERTIYIFMEMEENENRELQPTGRIVEGTTGAMRVLPSGDAEIQADAERTAFDDYREIQRLQRRGDIIVVAWNRVADRADSFAGRIVTEYCRGNGTYGGREEYKRLIAVFIEAYTASLRDELSHNQAIRGYIENRLEERLREMAIQDRRKAPPRRPDNKVVYHQRDLGVIQVLIVLGVSLEDAFYRWEEIHPLVDKYEEYYKNADLEVIWPRSQDTF